MKLKHFIITCFTCCGLFAAEEPLSLTIFKEISAEQKGNVLYSPNIMETSLAYVAQCTIGKTKDELRNLRYSAPDKYSAVHPLSAFALFVADDVKLKGKKLPILRVPFATKPAAAVKKINAWFSRKTRHLIPNAIGADDVSADTRLFFASALCMVEGWVETFDKTATVPNYPFTRSDGTVVKVPMMVAEDSTDHHYAEGEDWQAVRLVIMSNKKASYNKCAGSFIAIRPRGDVREFAAKLTPELLAHIYKELSRPIMYKEGNQYHIRYTDVKLPRFSLPPAEVDLTPHLKKLGVRTLFTPQADFSVLTDEQGLYLAHLKQKNAIEVHEDGFSAVSVMWGGVLGAYSGMVEHHFSITLDKPFIFIIGAAHPQVAPYFMGICENPAVAPAATVHADDIPPGTCEHRLAPKFYPVVASLPEHGAYAPLFEVTEP